MRRVYPLLFVLLWSTGFIGAKYGLPYAEPLAFLLARYGAVIVLMAVIAWLGRASWPESPIQYVHIAATGLLVHAVYLGGVFVAIKQGLAAGVTALVVGMQPLLTAAISSALLGERVSPRQWLGLLLGFVGVGFVVSGRLGESAWGAMLIPAMVALLGITLGTLYQKRFCPHFDLRSGSVIQFSAAAILTSVVLGVQGNAVDHGHIEWTTEFLFALAWLVLVLSIGAISLLNLLIRSGSAVNVASLFYLTPPTTAIIAWLMFGESLSWLGMAGMAMAVAGVYLVARPGGQRNDA